MKYGDKPHGKFARIGAAVITSGLWRDMTGAERGVYGVICFHANWRTGQCWPSYRRIRILSGCSFSTISASVRRLVRLGAINVHREKTKGGWRVVYFVPRVPTISPEDRSILTDDPRSRPKGDALRPRPKRDALGRYSTAIPSGSRSILTDAPPQIADSRSILTDDPRSILTDDPRSSQTEQNERILNRELNERSRSATGDIDLSSTEEKIKKNLTEWKKNRARGGGPTGESAFRAAIKDVVSKIEKSEGRHLRGGDDGDGHPTHYEVKNRVLTLKHGPPLGNDK